MTCGTGARARPAATALAWVAVAWLTACGGNAGGGTARGASSGETAEAETPDAIVVRVERVRVAPMSELYSTSTTLRADREATVIARTQGVVRGLLVEEGDRVSSGQTLAELENDEQRIELDRTRSVFEIEERDFERARKLHQDELLSFEDFEAARRDLEEARHAMARAELEFERTVIRAPFSGTVLRRHIDVGATVADGVAVYDLADLAPLYADVNVPERHVSRLEPGQPVRLVADAAGARATATIERVAPSVDPATGTVKVTLAVDGEAALRPGAFVRAEIVTETHPDALVVPRTALVADGRRWKLFRVGPSGNEVQAVEVTPGFEEGDRVEIATAAGALDPGDRVVVVGAPALTDGARVEIVDESPAGGEGAGEPA